MNDANQEIMDEIGKEMNCDCCGRHFTLPSSHEEYQGECFGFPAYEDTLGCPYCGGSYEEDDTSERSFCYED